MCLDQSVLRTAKLGQDRDRADRVRWRFGLRQTNPLS